MYYILEKKKWIGEGRAFDDSVNGPLKMMINILSDNGQIPSSYQDIPNLKEDFAPGSVLLDTANGDTYVYDGSQFKLFS